MARRRKRSLNLPGGTYGGYVVKHRRGVQYISGKPIRTKVKQTPELKRSKSLFNFFAELTTALHADPRMRAMWETSDVKGENTRHKVMHINYKFIPEDYDLTNLKLSPIERLFHAPIIETVWGINKVTIKFDKLEGLGRDTEYTVLSAHGVIRYYGCTDGGKKDYMIERVSSGQLAYQPGGQHALTLIYDSDYKKDYTNRQFCFILILQDPDGVAAARSQNIIL